MPLAIVDFRCFDAAKYEVICCDWYKGEIGSNFWTNEFLSYD